MMKIAKKLICIIFIIIAMFASSSIIFAIEFDTETIYNSIFVIYSGQNLGSGFAIGENCIITNAHVINTRENTKVSTYDGKKYDAFVVAMDQNLDIAVLGVKDVNFTPLGIAKEETILVGTDVYAIGAPNSLAYTLTKGVISAKERKVNGQSYVQTDAAINTGNSGGPLLNDKGEVVGVNSYKMSNSEGIGLAIPISEVTEFIKEKEINLNESGNVSETITPKTNTETNENNESNKDNVIEDIENNENKTEKNILISCLIISVLLNIILIVILIFQKRKNIYKKVEPSERTDFEIDILE